MTTFSGKSASRLKTTLSGKWTTTALELARSRGYTVNLFYVCLDTPERNVQRVRERVARGGHDVPEEDIRRRYARSLSNAKQLLSAVHQAIFLDNTDAQATLLLEFRSGVLIHKSRSIPLWAATLLEG